MSADATVILCTGCGEEIVGGQALVNHQGWFHNGDCVRKHWTKVGYVSGSEPTAPSDSAMTAERIAKDCTYLRKYADDKAQQDYSGLAARHREVAATIERLTADLARVRAELAEAEAKADEIIRALAVKP